MPTITGQTTGDTWTEIASGPFILTELLGSNVSGVDVSVSVRMMRGTSELIMLPPSLLPASKGFRPRFPAAVFPLNSHRIHVRSTGPVDWTLNTMPTVSARQTNRVARSSGDTWAALWSGPGEVASVVVANMSMGPALVSMRIARANGSHVLVSPELVAEGCSGRKMPVASLAAGETLEVKSIGQCDWTAFGIQP